jgi:hypothetical protein
MSLLDTASLVVTPNGTKASKLYSVVPSDGSGDLSVTRATTATRVNSSGLIESVASNVPRLDYTNGTCPSILVEPQRTNLLTYSNDFANSNWIKPIGSSLVLNSSVASPENGSTYTFTVAPTVFGSVVRQVLNVNNGDTYTISFFVKKGNYRYVGVRFNNSKNIERYPNYDFDTDTLNKQGVTCDFNRTLLNNGWVRLTLTFTATQIVSVCDIALTQANGDTAPALSGTEFVYIYGAQLEAGSYATSYIPTTSASVTRNADVISKTGISSLIGQSEGVLFFDGIVNNIQNINSNILNTNKSATTISTLQLGKGKSDNKFNFNFFFGDGTFNTITLLSSGTFANGSRTKVAVRYKSGDLAMYVNGTLQAISTSTYTANGTKSELFLNDLVTYFNYQESVSFNNVALWKTALTNTQLAQLTTI